MQVEGVGESLFEKQDALDDTRFKEFDLINGSTILVVLIPYAAATLDDTMLRWVIILVTKDFYGGSSHSSKLGVCGSGLGAERLLSVLR